MYLRQGSRSKHISIPQNYSGNAFSDKGIPQKPDETVEEVGGADEPQLSELELPDKAPKSGQKNLLPIFIKNEELIILGIILLIFQNEKGNEAIPILLALLFLGGDSNR